MIFWALEERKKMIEDRKMEGKVELIAAMLLSPEISDETKLYLEQWARENGIPVNQRPPR